jgi:hypothetical protein
MMHMTPADARWDNLIASAKQRAPQIVPAILKVRYDPTTYMRERLFAMTMLSVLLMLDKRHKPRQP